MPELTLPDDNKLVYNEAGSGSTALLMVHGFTGGKWYYENDLDTFSKKYRCIAPDLIGHGDSDKPTDRPYNVAQFARDISDVVNILELDRFVLLGHSMGGMISQVYALDHNTDGKCVGVVLISTAAGMLLADAIAASVKNEIGKYERGEWKFNEKIARAMARVAWASDYADAHPKEVNRAYEEGRRVPDIVRMRMMLAMTEEFDVRKRIGELNLPALVIVGAKDLLAGGSEKLAHSIPNALFLKIDGAGHMVNIETPEAVQEKIATFLVEEVAGS